MTQRTRDFEELYREYEDKHVTKENIKAIADEDKHVTKENIKAIADEVNTILRREKSDSITEVTAYILYEKGYRSLMIAQDRSLRLYFIIHSPVYPPDTHMIMPIVGNINFTAEFLEEDKQWAQEDLNEFESIVYI